MGTEDDEFVEAVEMAFEFQDLVAAGVGAGKTDGGHGGVGIGVHDRSPCTSGNVRRAPRGEGSGKEMWTRVGSLDRKGAVGPVLVESRVRGWRRLEDPAGAAAEETEDEAGDEGGDAEEGAG